MHAPKMASSSGQSAALIRLAQQYTAELESGQEQHARQTLDEINRLNNLGDTVGDSELFKQVGRLTRELHDSLSEFTDDSRMATLMQEEMPDARARLNHVIELTERSAHDTMACIEHSTPLIDLLQTRAGEIRQQLKNMMASNMKNDTVGHGQSFMSDELDDYLHRVQTDLKKVSADFSEILMAQGYQDITGQIIQRVITLVQDVEQNLVGLLKLGIESGNAVAVEKDDDEENRIGHGPAIPGSAKGGRCENQDQVDDLLSTLGF